MSPSPHSRWRTASNDGLHVASDDYKELTEILQEELPPEWISTADPYSMPKRQTLGSKTASDLSHGDQIEDDPDGLDLEGGFGGELTTDSSYRRASNDYERSVQPYGVDDADFDDFGDEGDDINTPVDSDGDSTLASLHTASRKTADMALDVIPLYSTADPLPGESLAREYALSPDPDEFAGEEIQVLSAEYRAMPILDRRAVDLWQQLGDICAEQRAELEEDGWEIIVQEEDPYATAEEMFADLDQKIYKVTTMHCHHPVWDLDTNVNFRIAHDILGHGLAQSDFSFFGEVLAYRSHCEHLPETLWDVIFTEIVAQSAYANVHHLFGEQKVGFLDFTPDEINALVDKVTDAPDPSYDALHYSASFKTADWDSVQSKAHDIFDIGGVRVTGHDATHIAANVMGDNGTYETELQLVPGTKQIALWNCFLPDAPILMADGSERPIAEIEVGDEVITHLGNMRRVLRIEPKQTRQDLTTVSFAGDPRPFQATTDHQVWARDKDGITGWKQCGSLTTDDYVSFAIPQEEVETSVLVMHPPRRPVTAASGVRGVHLYQREGYEKWCFNATMGGRDGHRYSRYFDTFEEAVWESENFYFEADRATIKIDEDLAYLLGWYAAEGALIRKEGGYRVAFSLHASEEWVCDLLDAICSDHFGVVGTRRRFDNQIDYRVSHWALYSMIEKLIGTGSKTKVLSGEIVSLPLPQQERFMEAWILGDGNEYRGRTTLTSASLPLLRQAREILARLGKVGYLASGTNPGGLKHRDRSFPIHTLRFNKTQKGSRCLVENNQVWHRILSVETSSFEGEVWDMEVMGDHSFRAYGVNAKNCTCPWAAYAFGRSGPWKKYEGRMCSHALALMYTLQAETMFGNEVSDEVASPGWDNEITRYEAPAPKEWRVANKKTARPALLWVATCDKCGFSTDASDDVHEADLDKCPVCGNPDLKTTGQHGWNVSRKETPMNFGTQQSYAASRRDEDIDIAIEAEAIRRVTAGAEDEAVFEPLIPTKKVAAPKKINSSTQRPRKRASIISFCAQCGNSLPLGQPYGICPSCARADRDPVVLPFPDVLKTVNGSHLAGEHRCKGCGETFGSKKELEHHKKKEVQDWSSILPMFGTVNDQPEPALPSTEGIGDTEEDPFDFDEIGDDEETATLQDGTMHASSRSWLMESGPGPDSDSLDIAKAAKAHLALKVFTRAEQDELINEGENVVASNLNKLQIEDTHYAYLEEALSEAEANNDNVYWW